MKTLIEKTAYILTIFLIFSCKKFVAIDVPKDQIVTAKVFTSDETAKSAIRGIYADMMSGTGFASGGNNSVTLLTGRSSDDFTNQNSNVNYIQFQTNNLLPTNNNMRLGLWQDPYKYIYFANSIIENLAHAPLVSPAVKQQLTGEAKFIRAFCHFYLTNLFGAVPIVVTTDFRINANAFANTKEQVYLQITKDLSEAKAELSEGYPSAERIRPNRTAATAFLARVYLYTNDYVNAEKQASEVIAKVDTYDLVDLDKVFLKNSKEAILQFFVPASAGRNTIEGNIFILTAAPGSTTHIVLSPGLVEAFNSTDKRLPKWIGTYSNGTSSWNYPFKYKVKTGATPLTEYSMVLRLAEQYLIRAEARAMQNNFEGARNDINKIRFRAGLADTDLNTLPELLLAIEKERRLEFFAEWGHRWLDLKRTNRADAVLSTLKSPNWLTTDQLFPIPQTELNNNINLVQNKGY